MTNKLTYQRLAELIDWNPTPSFVNQRLEDINRVMDTAPSGSGIDDGTKLDDTSTANKLVFNTGFHHMNENGYYDGWTDHQVIVTPSLAYGFDMRITGRDRNDIKDYLYEVYDCWLRSEIK